MWRLYGRNGELPHCLTIVDSRDPTPFHLSTFSSVFSYIQVYQLWENKLQWAVRELAWQPFIHFTAPPSTCMWCQRYAVTYVELAYTETPHWKDYPFRSHRIMWAVSSTLAQRQFHSLWSSTETWLLLVENFTQYPARMTWNIVSHGNFCQSLRRPYDCGMEYVLIIKMCKTSSQASQILQCTVCWSRGK